MLENLNLLNFINAIVVIIGLPMMVKAAFYIGKKLQILTDLRNDTKKIHKDIEKIKSKFLGYSVDIQGLKVHTNYGYSHSPTLPNEAGKKLLKESGFDKIYPQLKNEIFALLDSWNVRTLYDYEKAAEKALDEIKDNPLIDPIKDHAVNNPDEPLKLIFEVASWVIRDDYDQYKKSRA